jgi:class 3 adenylate cyclase/tetratricopeptide (TPR) repeat protein/predicted Ser/Thr protein kinase
MSPPEEGPVPEEKNPGMPAAAPDHGVGATGAFNSGMSSQVGTRTIGTAEAHARPAKADQGLPLGQRFGRYFVERELGRGGMGAVYLAVDTQLDRKVALKVPFVRGDDLADLVDRFRREARAMATVHHANLCPVYDVGEINGQHFLSMAFIEGETLARLIRDRGAQPVAQAVRLVRTIALAVQKAHDAGIIHRDLKPANVMLNAEGEPIVMDFGLARRNNSGEAELTHSGLVIGSPAYMAPEQVEARHHQVGPWTDVWAMGVILYELLTGRRPFEGSAAVVLGRIMERDPLPFAQLGRPSPPGLEAVCRKALAKDIAGRYPTARAFADDLAPWLTPTAPGQVAIAPTPAGGSGPEPVKADSSQRRRRNAELRQVTVCVFNFEAADAAADVEERQEVIETFRQFVTARVRRFGGATMAPSGQEVLACFGFPVAYEDSAQRAVRAALAVLKDAAADPDRPANLPAAAGIWGTLHTGEAIAEETGDEESNISVVSVVGEARTTAVRLDGVLEPGSVLITAATRQRVQLYFETESLGAQRVRGLPQPVELFRVVKEAASRNRVELVDPGNLTPLIGRDTELGVLKDRWEQALDGLGQVVLLFGDAGLGKSRLIREIRGHVADGDGDEPAVIEWRCSQYHQNAGFFPAVEYLSRLLDLDRQAPDADRFAAVGRYLRELGLGSPENVLLLAGLLSVTPDAGQPPLNLSPQRQKELTEALLRDWLRALATRRPTLFIVEDLHWIDPTTQEFIKGHVEDFGASRLLTILTCRPEYQTPWRGLPHLTQIALNRLTKRQIADMMRRRAKNRDIPDAVVRQMADRTDGVPLFIEEFTTLIIESGALDGAASDSVVLEAIPATLQDLLIARLDRMASNPEVVQVAAAIGREFSYVLLAAACDLPGAELLRELDKLVRAEIFFQKGRIPDAQFIFKHALIQDSAYHAMLRKKRQDVHRRIAAALEVRFPDVTATQPELLAQHFSEAGDAEKALAYWLKAGQRSQEKSANVEAIQQFESGLALVAALPPSPRKDLLELSFKLPLSAALMAVQGYGAPQVEPVQNRCIEICRQHGEGSPLFPILIANWEWQFIRGRFATCYERCDEVIRLAEAERGPGMLSEAHWTHVCTSFYAGDFPAAREHAEVGWQHYDRAASIEYTKITQQNCGPLLLVHLGMALWQTGHADQAFARVREALALARDLNHLFTSTVIEWKAGQTYEFAGLGDQAVEFGERTVRIAGEQAFAFWVALGTGCKGVGLKHLGRFDEAIDALRDAVARLYATGSVILFPKYKGHLADALWRAGRRDEAWEKLEEASADQAAGERMMAAELLRFRGDFHYDLGDWDRAEASYQEALAVATRQRAKMYELRATLRLGQLWRGRGRAAEARERLLSACAWFTEGLDLPDLRAARQFLAEDR